MKKFFVVVTVLMITVFTFNSCDVKKEDKKINIQNLIDSTSIDLATIKISPKKITESTKELDSFKGSLTERKKLLRKLLKADKDNKDLIQQKLSLFDKEERAIKTREDFARLNAEKKSFITNYTNNDTTSAFNRYLLTVLEKDPEKILKIAKSIIEENSESPYGYLALVEHYVKARKFNKLNEIATIYYLALKKDPQNELAYEGLSALLAYTRQADKKAALDGIYLQIDPASKSALEGLIQFYIQKKDYDNAQKTLEIFNKNNPGLLSFGKNANFYLEMKKNDLAEAELEKAKKNNEVNSDYYYVSASVSAKKNEIDKAVTNLEKFSEISQDDPYLNYIINSPLFNEKLYKSKNYKNLLKKIEPNTPVVGEKIPDLTGLYTDSIKFKMKDIKDKVVLLDFWASWCSPCKKEMPNVIEVFNKYHKNSFDVLGINLDKGLEECNQYFTENKIKWKHLFSGKVWQDENVQKFGVKGIPATFLIDKNGIIRFKHIRGLENLQKYVKMLTEE